MPFSPPKGPWIAPSPPRSTPSMGPLLLTPWCAALDRALRRLMPFAPQFLVLALGLDTAKGDPMGSWSWQARDFEANGRTIGTLPIPNLVGRRGL